MFLTEEKIRARIQELSGYRYRDRKPIVLFAKEKIESDSLVSPTVPEYDDTWEEIKIGEAWKGRDRYLWLHTSFEIPTEWKGKKVLGLFDFGKTGDGNNSGFESLLYLNGEPFQGVDSNHKEVFLPEHFEEDLDLTFRLWSGLEGGGMPREIEHRMEQAEFAWLDERIDDLYYMSRTVLETVHVLNPNAPKRAKLLSLLNEGFKLIDWSDTESADFIDSLYEAQALLNERIDSFDKQSLVTVNCIGHTHIDVAWLWRLKHTREKAARSFSTVLRLMEQYPEYIFLQSQPQLYEYIKQDYPEIYEQMKKRIDEGRWEPDGGMWLEADCNIPSGESLVRQILFGRKFFKEEFNKDIEYLWLPDVFGYSWALPQILMKSGIPMFMTTKISWNQYNRMPHDTFMWRGIDGSEVLTHFITTPELWRNDDSWFYTYNGVISPKTVNGIWEGYRNKEINQELLLSYGYGDGGGGVNREMLEMRRRVDKMPGLPHTKTSTAGSFFRGLQDRVKNTQEYVHTWDGELYLEYHRGTYTSQAYNKKMNRKLELLYRDLEWLHVLNGAFNNNMHTYPKERFDDGWKIILRNQFHDIIPGSAIKEVYEDSRVEYAEAEGIGSELKQEAMYALTESREGVWTVFNSAGWTRDEQVFIETKESGTFYDGNEELLAQKMETGYLVKINNIPDLGWKNIKFEKQIEKRVDSSFTYSSYYLETPHYIIQWNEQGQLISLFGKQAEREVLKKNHRGNVLQVFEDRPLAHDAWDIDIFYQEKMVEVTSLQSVNLIENGPLQAVVQFEWKYKNSLIRQNLKVYSDSRRIDFDTYVDWRQRRQLLKAAFSVDIEAKSATYDVQYGNVQRPNHWNTSWDLARFESVGHQWADLSEQNYGVSLLNDCKYGYDIKGNVLRLSLLKGSVYPDPDADLGEHTFTYSLLPHSGDWLQADTVRQAWSLNSPLIIQTGQMKSKEQSLFSIDNRYVQVDCVKKAEDSNAVVLRLHDFSGGRQKVTITSALPFFSWAECDLMERNIEEEKMGESNIELILSPYEIKTIKVYVNI